MFCLIAALGFAGIGAILLWASREDRKEARRFGMHIIIPVFWVLACLSLLSCIPQIFATIIN